MVDPDVVEIAERELTAGQLEVWRLALQGESQRGISYRLDLARSTITDRLDAANRRLRAHGVVFAPDGEPYLSQTPTSSMSRNSSGPQVN